MDNTLKVRVNPELLDFYKGKPSETKKALQLYMEVKSGFLQQYVKESE